MILVFGGTTEGKIVTDVLEEARLNYIYSTKTSLDFNPKTYGSYRYGAFTNDTLINFCQVNLIRTIIHASHPFAIELHRTIVASANQLNIPVLRFERIFLARIQNDLVKYFKSYTAAVDFLIHQKLNNLLALTGVQTIDRLKPYWLYHRAIFRILPRPSSVLIAQKAGFPKENLLLQMVSDNLDAEINIIKTFQIQCILTKESGASGFLYTKIEAALTCQIPILIVEKPLIPDSFIKVYNKNELLTQLHTLIL